MPGPGCKYCLGMLVRPQRSEPCQRPQHQLADLLRAMQAGLCAPKMSTTVIDSRMAVTGSASRSRKIGSVCTGSRSSTQQAEGLTAREQGKRVCFQACSLALQTRGAPG